MNATRFLLIAIVAIVATACSNTQKVVVTDNTHSPNANQLSILEHAKTTYSTGNAKIQLPYELNALLGDTTQRIVALPLWDQAYFVNDGKEALVVPLKSNLNGTELFSDLIVTQKGTTYPKMVTTYLQYNTDNATEYIHIESTASGLFYRSLLLDNKNRIIDIVGENGVVQGKTSPKLKNHGKKTKTPRIQKTTINSVGLKAQDNLPRPRQYNRVQTTGFNPYWYNRIIHQ